MFSRSGRIRASRRRTLRKDCAVAPGLGPEAAGDVVHAARPRTGPGCTVSRWHSWPRSANQRIQRSVWMWRPMERKARRTGTPWNGWARRPGRPGAAWCREPESNRHGAAPQGILSPLRLPVSPSRHRRDPIFGRRRRGCQRTNENEPPGGSSKVEAAPGLEPGITVLQTVALASWLCRLQIGRKLGVPIMGGLPAGVNPAPPAAPESAAGKPDPASPHEMERATRLELATSTLAR